jgi:hypothetical protein
MNDILCEPLPWDQTALLGEVHPDDCRALALDADGQVIGVVGEEEVG